MAKPTEDLADIMSRGLDRFGDAYKQAVRNIKRETTRPLDPAAEKLSGAEIAAGDALWLDDDAALLGTLEEEAARYQLPATRPIPRSFWERLRRAVEEG